MATAASSRPDCPLCITAGGTPLSGDDRLRVVLVDDVHHPAFVRVIWSGHVAEMSDLASAERDHLMRVVFEVEQVVREVCGPDKINLASLGNRVAHLHWHVIGRWRDDQHFPDSVWSAPANDPADAARRADQVRLALPSLVAALRARLAACGLRDLG